MKKRYAVLGLSLVLALALAVPAFGGPTNLLAKAGSNVKATANKALKKAKEAQSTATAAQAAANAANAEAKAASNDAGKAQTEAGKALTEAKKGVTNAAAAQNTANNATNLANQAKAAAAAAEANANTRIKDSVQVIGAPSVETAIEVHAASVSCPAGTVILGGGYQVSGESGAAIRKVTVYEQGQQLYGGGWFAAGTQIVGQNPTWKIAAIAECGTK